MTAVTIIKIYNIKKEDNKNAHSTLLSCSNTKFIDNLSDLSSYKMTKPGQFLLKSGYMYSKFQQQGSSKCCNS